MRTELKYSLAKYGRAIKEYRVLSEEQSLDKLNWEKSGLTNFFAGNVDLNVFYETFYEKGEFILLYFGAGWSPPCR